VKRKERQMGSGDYSNRIFYCRAEHIWQPGIKAFKVLHPDAVELRQEDGWPGGDVVVYECPHCKHRFRIELPQ